MQQTDLEKHLLSFEIQHFESDEYWNWAGKTLGKTRTSRLNALRRPLQQGEANRSHFDAFYQYIAYPAVSGIVHSMKANAILQTGTTIDRNLPAKGRILDLGCATGYLTMFYALQSSDRELYGCDVTPRAVTQATKEAEKRGIKNINFSLNDITSEFPNDKFDAIVSSQVVGKMHGQSNTLQLIANSLTSAGSFVSVEDHGTSKESLQFVRAAGDNGLNLVAFKFVEFSDLGCAGAYPFFVFSKEDTVTDFKNDIDEAYSKFLSKYIQ